MVLLHVVSAVRMGPEGFARLLGAIQALSKMGCAKSMVPKRSARLTIARLLLTDEDCVAGMVVAAPTCARLRAARRLLLHAAVAVGMVRMGGARLMDAPPQQEKGSSIAPHTAAGRRSSRAPWQAAPPPLNARVSVTDMAVAELERNAGSLAAATECTAF